MESDQEHRFEIDPREHARDLPYMTVLIVWGAVALSIGVVCVMHAHYGLAVCAGLLLLVVPWSFSRRNEVLSVVVGRRKIRLIRNRDESSAVVIRKGAGIELTLENVERGPDRVGESSMTLNLWYMDGGYRQRQILGTFLSLEAKQRVFEELVDFFRDAGVDVEVRNDYAPQEDV